jgi:sulfur oxygenase/reductase
LGYQANIQTGIFPMAGRFGGASIHMETTLNPLRLYQYTIWQSQDDHLDFHATQFARVFELCVHCLSMVVQGPWEPTYTIAGADMPLIRTAFTRGASTEKRIAPPQRTVAITEHVVKLGEEAEFEDGLIEVATALADSAGCLGYMLLRPHGVNPLGSFAFDPASAYEMLMTLGANPPANPVPRFKPAEALSRPLEYLLHSEWESPELAEAGLGKALVNREIRTLYGKRVLPHTIRAGYTTLFNTMMEEPGWRNFL